MCNTCKHPTHIERYCGEKVIPRNPEDSDQCRCFITRDGKVLITIGILKD